MESNMTLTMCPNVFQSLTQVPLESSPAWPALETYSKEIVIKHCNKKINTAGDCIQTSGNVQPQV